MNLIKRWWRGTPNNCQREDGGIVMGRRWSSSASFANRAVLYAKRNKWWAALLGVVTGVAQLMGAFEKLWQLATQLFG